jgi:hypothetical protein
MDLLIPPLALYFLCVALSLPLLALGSYFNTVMLPAMWISTASAVALFVAVTIAWLQHARHLLSLREVLTVPLYAAWKLPVYLAYFLQHKSGWTKTIRKV